jgi:hypothetical protein
MVRRAFTLKQDFDVPYGGFRQRDEWLGTDFSCHDGTFLSTSNDFNNVPQQMKPRFLPREDPH